MPDSKSGYHHGDLRSALIDAGLALTRAGGPDALSIREATRRVGVSPNAAYRHFADREALLTAVAEVIQERIAARMRSAGANSGPPAESARRRLRAVGLGYIEFALDEPGWFGVVFFGANLTSVTDEAGASLAPPYRALVEALDAMLTAGVLTPRRREGAEWSCWSAVHGFAGLALHGPLREASRRELNSLARRTVDDIIAGISANDTAPERR